MNKTKNIKIRKAKNRGHGNYGWLNTYHTFSFGEYHDPDHMGYRTLRVINDDTVKSGMGFETHRHQDMEIITYVVEGQLEHRDSMGNGSVIAAGSFQRMTAGTGVMHSEFNPSKESSTRLLQIWILPQTDGLAPSYEELSLKKGTEGLTLVAAAEPMKGVMKVHQDCSIYFGRLKEYSKADVTFNPGRGAWLQMIKGKLKLFDSVLDQGDGAAIDNETKIATTGLVDCEFLLFDLK